MSYLATNDKIKIKQRFVSVFLEDIDSGLNQLKEHMFFCQNCRNPILQYEGEVVMVVPGLAPAKLPLTVLCSNEKCRTKYRFVSFVETASMI